MDWEAVEFGVRAAMLRVGAAMMETLLNADEGGYQGPRLHCSEDHEMGYHALRWKEVVTVVGKVRVGRSYYYDAVCQQGVCPKDWLLDIEGTSFSPGVRRLMGRVGASRSFALAQEDLQELAGIVVHTKDIERIAEGVGVHAEAFLQTERPVEEVPRGTTLYVSIDGTGVPMVAREVEGRSGKTPGGQAKTREVKLGCVFTQTRVDAQGAPVRDEASTSYVGAIENAEAFGIRIERELHRRGDTAAGTVVLIADGAPWIWNLAQDRFPHAHQVIDLYHAREHYWAVAHTLYSHTPAQMEVWAEARRQELDRGDVEAVVRAMRRLRPRMKEQQEVRDREVAFFIKNSFRMRYQTFRARGWFVGSGVLEAGCRTIVSQRLKQSGMHWTARGANSIIALRCCLLSHRWEDFWAHRAAA
jgi:hypothetical protein